MFSGLHIITEDPKKDEINLILSMELLTFNTVVGLKLPRTNDPPYHSHISTQLTLTDDNSWFLVIQDYRMF
jgi:hypothetical protein